MIQALFAKSAYASIASIIQSAASFSAIPTIGWGIGIALIAGAAIYGGYILYKNRKESQQLKSKQLQAQQIKINRNLKNQPDSQPQKPKRKTQKMLSEDKNTSESTKKGGHQSDNDSDQEKDYPQDYKTLSDSQDSDLNHDEKFLKNKSWEKLWAQMHADYLREKIEEIKEKNRKLIEWMLLWAKTQYIFLNDLVKKIQKAIQQQSSQAIQRLFKKVEEEKVSFNDLESKEDKEVEQLTPEKIMELLEKIQQIYSQPIQNPELKTMVIALFAKIQKNIVQRRKRNITNPIVKEAMAYIDSLQKLILQQQELLEIKRLLKIKRQNAPYKREKIIDLNKFISLKKELGLSNHSVHHIIPYNWIKKILTGIVNHLADNEILSILNEIVNHSKNQKFKDYLKKRLANKTQKNQPAYVLANLILAFIFQNPRNLVLGAFNLDRSNDPKQHLDEEIITVQSQIYKEAITIIQKMLENADKSSNDQEKVSYFIEGLKTLCTLPWPINGEWVKDANGKYSIEKRKPADEKLNIKGIKFDKKLTIKDVLQSNAKDEQTQKDQKSKSNEIKTDQKISINDVLESIEKDEQILKQSLSKGSKWRKK